MTTSSTVSPQLDPRSPDPPTRRSPWRAVVVVAVALTLALAVAVAMRPSPPSLPAAYDGDAELAQLARGVAGEQHRALAAAVVTPQGVRTATIGADLEGRFEVGSITKGLTGLLLQDAIDRGEVTAGTRLGELLPLDGTDAGDATLADLAQHVSGLPGQPENIEQLARNYWSQLSGSNPYPQSSQWLVDAAGAMPTSSGPGTYSNVAFGLLGTALAESAGTPFPQLLDERVLTPIGMHDAFVPETADQLGSRDLTGSQPNGRSAGAWAGGWIGPAGGLRATVTDMATLAERLLAEDVPGVAALEPTSAFGPDRIGWAWITSDLDGWEVVWHNGATGGFGAFLGLDRAAGTAVVLLSATQGFVDAAALELLARAGELS